MLVLLISCINIENNIKEIANINENIKKCNSKKNLPFQFQHEKYEINKLLEIIKSFGKIYYNNFFYKFKKCPININEARKYEINGQKGNIFS